MMTPPIAIIGDVTTMVQVIRTSICTCCTSLVLRVIRLAAPIALTSRRPKSSTCPNTAPRTSRPNCMAAFEPR